MNRTRRMNPSTAEALALWSLIGLVAVVVGVTWTSVHLATALSGAPAAPDNPVLLLTGLRPGGATTWTPTATLVAALELGSVLVVLVLAGVAVARRTRGRLPVDRAVAQMPTSAPDAPLTARYAGRVARRLGMGQATPGEGIGMPLGMTVPAGLGRPRPLVRSWEDVTLVIAGPRMGKTTSLVIPEILAAPGPVLTTSNKTDVLEVTRSLRATRGQVWVFDPQQLAGEPVSWWWDPLFYVTDEVKAVSLATTFMKAAQETNQTENAYFRETSKGLLANYLHAAALMGAPITQVYLWLTNPNNTTPADVLEEHGFAISAANVRTRAGAAEGERSGIYGTATTAVAFMNNSVAMAWATPPRTPLGLSGTRVFDPAAFVASAGDTLYSLSKEGQGSTGALVAALTVAVCEAAEARARTQGGRLAVPLIVSLDEAANVCRWSDLPQLYSHYGSRGILVSTYVQNAAQGIGVWGKEGWQQLFSAATVTVYAGGETDTGFLRELSHLIGDYTTPVTNVSHSRTGGRSISTGQDHTEALLDVSDLAALGRGRAVVFAAGRRPTLMRTVPWMEGPHAEAVAATQAAGPAPAAAGVTPVGVVERLGRRAS